MRFSFATLALTLFGLAQAQIPSGLPPYGVFTAKTPADAETIASVHSVLALFNLALDAKNYEALRDVYTQDVVARVSLQPINDLESLIKFYNGTVLGNVVTQHTAHTIFVYDIAPHSAKSISYANALYFSPIEKGKFFARDALTFYERYDDVWAKQPNGQWKIRDRGINIYAQVGNTSLLPPTQPTFNTTK